MAERPRNALADMARVSRPRNALADMLAEFQPGPIHDGPSLTMPSPDFVPGQRPIFALPAEIERRPLVTPEENGRRMAYAMLPLNFMGSIRNAGTPPVYVRRTPGPSPANDVGHMMYAEVGAYGRGDIAEAMDHLRGYGSHGWTAAPEGAVDAASLGPDIVRVLRREAPHLVPNPGDAARAARLAAPQNIVDSAGLWDDAAMVREVWDHILEPRGITAVRTPDGLISFDPTHARPWTPPEGW